MALNFVRKLNNNIPSKTYKNYINAPTHEIKTDNRMGYGVEIEVLPS